MHQERRNVRQGGLNCSACGWLIKMRQTKQWSQVIRDVEVRFVKSKIIQGVRPIQPRTYMVVGMENVTQLEQEKIMN